MILAHKTKLYPTKSQRIYFAKAFGCSRFAYNWAANNLVPKNLRELTPLEITPASKRCAGELTINL